jgi:hypothetical protein
MAYLISFYSMLIFPLTSFAPNAPYTAYIETGNCINIGNIYEPLIQAIFTWETRGSMDTLAYNPKEGATGGLQIRQCRVDHYNTITGKNYTLKDMYDFNKAREVFLLFAQGKTFEQAAKSWNGSGPLTIKYWEAVSAILKKNAS